MTAIKEKEFFDCQLFLHGISQFLDYTMSKTTTPIPQLPPLTVSSIKHYLDQTRN